MQIPTLPQLCEGRPCAIRATAWIQPVKTDTWALGLTQKPCVKFQAVLTVGPCRSQPSHAWGGRLARHSHNKGLSSLSSLGRPLRWPGYKCDRECDRWCDGLARESMNTRPQGMPTAQVPLKSIA